MHWRPGYNGLWVYGGGEFDYQYGKMSLPRKPWADKKEWWQSVHEARQSPDWKPGILQVSFWKSGERHSKPPSPLEEYIEAFDYWLGEADGIQYIHPVP